MDSTRRHFRGSHSLLLLVFLLLFFNGNFSFGQNDNHNSGSEEVSQAELTYRKAKDFYYRLERDEKFGSERGNWLTGVRKFRRLYILDNKSALAPSCLYNMARIHHRMFHRFKLPIDLDEAIVYYKDVANVFPDNSLADDAVFAVAEIYLNEKLEPEKAARSYAKVIERFPDGDKYAQSITRLQDLSKKYNIKLPKKLSGAGSLDHLVNVLPVKYWSSDDYTRIVIRSTEPVQYTASLLEKNANKPRRLYIDFAQSYTPPRFRAPIPIQDGLLKQVRTGQFNQSTVRVVLDIESISNYKIFSLNDPFRVIVDVHGEKKSDRALNPNSTPLTASTPTIKTPPENVEQTPTITAADSPHRITILDDQKKWKPEAKLADATQGGSPNTNKLSLAQQLGLGVKRIVIDPGHGGKDPGAMAHGLKEKDLVLQVAKVTAAALRKKYGYEVILTRTTDTFIELEERTAIANTQKADLFLSIHVNAHHLKSVRGIETFYLNLATNTEAMRVAARENATSTHSISDLQDILANLMQNSKIQESSRLAQNIHNSIISGLDPKNYKVKSLGVKQAPFYVLIGAQMPAILAEISFITNPEEAKHLQTAEFLHAIGTNIASGVAGYVENTTAALKL